MRLPVPERAVCLLGHKASLNGDFIAMSCTFNMVTHQQKWNLCMKWVGERRRKFRLGETTSRCFQTSVEEHRFILHDPVRTHMLTIVPIFPRCRGIPLPRCRGSRSRPLRRPQTHPVPRPHPAFLDLARAGGDPAWIRRPPWIHRRQSEPPRIRQRQINPGDAFPVEEGTVANIGSA